MSTPNLNVRAKIFNMFYSVLIMLAFVSCESDETRMARLAIEEEIREQRIERERLEQEAEEKRIAEELRQKAIMEEFGKYHLQDGDQPWRECFGKNSLRGEKNSSISVTAPVVNDVVLVIKKDGKVVAHTYIRGGRTRTIDLPNGTYQPFFYSGSGWYPEKEMASESCESLKGGFLSKSGWSKDEPQYLEYNALSYTLIPMESGNFTAEPSDEQEAL